jgi:hypothetical protein
MGRVRRVAHPGEVAPLRGNRGAKTTQAARASLEMRPCTKNMRTSHACLTHLDDDARSRLDVLPNRDPGRGLPEISLAGGGVVARPLVQEVRE